MSTKNYKQFTEVSYSGTQLLKKHKLTETGMWQIRGEDSNCDLGGSHYMPDLGIYEGTLQDIIEMAVELPNFWQWGGGGEITKISVGKVKTKSEKDKEELAKQKALAKLTKEEKKLLGLK